MSHAKSVITAIAAVVIALPVCASANTITGGIHFSGDVTISTTAGNGMLTFDFLPPPESAETFIVDSGSGFFAGLGGFGDESNFSSLAAPVGTTVSIPELTFTGTPDTFTMTEVFAGIDSPLGCIDNPALAAPGNTCSVPGTPYNLQDLGPTGQNSSATFVVEGYILDGTTHNAATITFTAASTGKSFEQILLDQANGVADVITFGAQLQISPPTITQTPEPGTTSLMLGAGLLLAGGMLRRKKNQ